MKETDRLIQAISHRPWVLPTGQWKYYQEWNDALFLHWKVSANELSKLIPSNISIDAINGESWVSLVAFTMQKIRPNSFPSISIVSDFHEINVRTYLTSENKPGVYFLNIESGKMISTLLARSLSGLPYGNSQITRNCLRETHKYSSTNNRKNFSFNAEFVVREKILGKSELDRWLTERYCLYFDNGTRLYRYEVHHQPWDLYNVEIQELQANYKIGGLSLSGKPDLAHYSKGVQVISWQKELLSKMR